MTAIYWPKRDVYIVITEERNGKIGFTKDDKFHELHRYCRDCLLPVGPDEAWEVCYLDRKFRALRNIVARDMVFKSQGNNKCEVCGGELLYIQAENITICPKCIQEGRE